MNVGIYKAGDNHDGAVIDAAADTVWSRIRDFNALPLWHPAIADSRIENNEPSDRVGCIRHFHTRDGGMIRERLLALSDYEYTQTYEILESPMGVANYVATLKLTPVTDGGRCFADGVVEEPALTVDGGLEPVEHGGVAAKFPSLPIQQKRQPRITRI